MNKKVFLQKLNHSLVYAKGLGALDSNAFFLCFEGECLFFWTEKPLYRWKRAFLTCWRTGDSLFTDFNRKRSVDLVNKGFSVRIQKDESTF